METLKPDNIPVPGIITVSDISKSFGDKIVLSHFSCKFYQGFNLLTGSSGIGKTTLLRILSGAEKPESGTVSGISGDVTYMFQEDRLFPWLSAYENVTSICKKSRDASAVSNVNLLLSSLLIEPEDQNKYPSELSGGMKRRVALARAIVFSQEHNGNTVLLDEPFKGLDAATKSAAVNICKDVFKGKTVIIVTHYAKSDSELSGAREISL